MPRLEIPFRLIRDLPVRAQQEIARDFDEVTAVLSRITSLFGLDAIVDPSIGVDSPSTHTYITVGNAIRGEKALAGGTWPANTYLRLGMAGDTTESVAIAAADVPAFVRLIGMTGGSYRNPGNGSDKVQGTGDPQMRWLIDNVSINFSTLIMEDLQVERTTTSNLTLFDTVSTAIFIRSRVTQGAYSSTMMFVDGTSNVIYAIDSTFFNVKFTSPVYAHDSSFDISSGSVQAISSQTWFAAGLTLVGGNIRVASGTGSALTLTSTGNFIGVGFQSAISSNCTIALSGSTTNTKMVWLARPGTSGSNEVPILTISGTYSEAHVDGSFTSLTVSAPNSGWRHRISATVESTADITGPAEVIVTAISGVTLRGSGNRASISASGSGTTVPALDLINCDSSLIELVARGGSTARAYRFDAASTDNLLIVAGIETTGLAPIDNGLRNRILTGQGATFTFNGAPTTTVVVNLAGDVVNIGGDTWLVGTSPGVAERLYLNDQFH